MQPQCSQGAAPSHHPPPFTLPKVLQSNGGSTTSSLRQWRKKDFVEKQAPTETNQPSTNNENPSHIARVAPHTYYPRTPEDPCNYQQQYGEYSASYKPPAPVKYSEIVENQQPQTIEQITPVLQKQKEKEYVDMCNGPIQQHLKQFSDHLPMKQSTYSDSLPLSHHQYIPKDSQMYPFLQKQPQLHQYIQKEPYQQFLSKYNMHSQFPPQYNSQPNDFLAHLNKINPRMAQSIINDTHLRDSQIPMYHNLDQNRPYPPQPQRMYHPPAAPCNPNAPQRPSYNYSQYNYNIKPNISPGDPYNRVHQYHHNGSKYAPEQHSPQRYYNDPMNYGPFPPNYSQLEYAQHYQHRRQFSQEYYLHPSYKATYPPEEMSAGEPGSRKSSLKQYLESWVEEDLAGNAPDIIAPITESVEKGTLSAKGGGAQDQPLYVLDTTDIPNDNLPHFLHLQQIEKLPDNIKGYYHQAGEKENLDGAIIPEIFDQECSIVATVENEKVAENNLEDKVVQIHIVENVEAADDVGLAQSEGVIKMCRKSVVSCELSDSQSMPEINDCEKPKLPEAEENQSTNLEDAIVNSELVISNNCDTENIPLDLADITNDTNTSKDSETLQKTDENISNVEVDHRDDSSEEESDSLTKEDTNSEALDTLLEEITKEPPSTPPPKLQKEEQQLEDNPPESVDEDIAMPVLEREVQDENETNVVYHVDDSNIVLQIGDELLEINVTVQNDKKIIMVKTFSDALIMNNPEETLEEQPLPDLPILESIDGEITDIPIGNDVCVYNEEIVSSSTETETKLLEDVPEETPSPPLEEETPVPKESNQCLKPKPLKKKFKTKAALKLIETTEVPKPKVSEEKIKRRKQEELKRSRQHKEQKKVKSRDVIKKKVRNHRREQKNDDAKNIDMLYKMSIVPTHPVKVSATPRCVEEKVSVQEHSITSSTCQENDSEQRKRANEIIQQITDDWEDDLDVVKQEDNKRRLSLQEYNDRKRETKKTVDYDKFDLTSNLLQSVPKKRESPEVVQKNEESLSSRIELQLPNQRRLLPKPNYNQEYLRNALLNDLQTVNQITTTLMKENQQLMQRFLEQQRLTAAELKKVKQIIRYKRLVHHLSNMKMRDAQDGDVFEPVKVETPKLINVAEKRKKRRFRFLYSGTSESDDNKDCCAKRAHTETAVDYSVHQGNSQGQLTLVFKRSFKSDPKMQPFVKLERIQSLDWLASKL